MDMMQCPVPGFALASFGRGMNAHCTKCLNRTTMICGVQGFDLEGILRQGHAAFVLIGFGAPG